MFPQPGLLGMPEEPARLFGSPGVCLVFHRFYLFCLSFLWRSLHVVVDLLVLLCVSCVCFLCILFAVWGNARVFVFRVGGACVWSHPIYLLTHLPTYLPTCYSTYPQGLRVGFEGFEA